MWLSGFYLKSNMKYGTLYLTGITMIQRAYCYTHNMLYYSWHFGRTLAVSSRLSKSNIFRYFEKKEKCYAVKKKKKKWIRKGTQLALLRAPLSVLLTVSSSCNLCKARTPLSGGRSQPISIRSPAVQTTPTPPAPQPWNAGSLRGPVGPCLCMRPAQAWSPISLKGKVPTQRRVSPPCNPSHLM